MNWVGVFHLSADVQSFIDIIVKLGHLGCGLAVPSVRVYRCLSPSLSCDVWVGLEYRQALLTW